MNAADSAIGVEFLGNKRRLLPFLLPLIQDNSRGSGVAVDLFAGSGSVSGALKAAGFRVVANDHLAWCSTVTKALLLNDAPPPFAGLREHVSQSSGGGHYRAVLGHLNALKPERGFVWRHYSLEGSAADGAARMYFTADNAARIDAIRAQIARWSDFLEPREEALLLADLVRATSRVSNIAGTYGCYLKRWKPRALTPLWVTPSQFSRGGVDGHEVHCTEAERVAVATVAEVVYADPPYTKRQYAAYYHVLETIVLADSPSLSGSTGLRPWREKASDYCYKQRAPAALVRLVTSLRCRDFFLSYSEDGQIAHSDVIRILGERGKVRVFETMLGRYKSSDKPHRGANVTERLYHLRLAA